MAKIPSQKKVPRELPTGLRVLAIDQDHKVLDFIKQMCNQFQYLVMTWDKSPLAWSFVRERQDLTDVILMEVHMPQMDGFEFLQRASREINVPIIMMSVDHARSTVNEAFKLGACDYWIKPLHADLFKKMWKHVVGKDLSGKKKSELASSSVIREQNSGSANETDEVNESEHSNPPVIKRPRMKWTEALHQEFVKVVQQVGLDDARPKFIHEVMSKSIPGLTRENVASHLQIYRQHLKTISEGGAQQQKEMPLPSTVVEATESRACSSGRLNCRDLPYSSNHVPYETGAVTPHPSITRNLTPNEEQCDPTIQLSRDIVPIQQFWTESDAQAIENQGIIQRNNGPRMKTQQQQMQQQRQQSPVHQIIPVTYEYSSDRFPASMFDRPLMHQPYTPTRPHNLRRPFPAVVSYRSALYNAFWPADLEIRSPASNSRNQNISTDININTRKKRPNSMNDPEKDHMV